MLKLSGGTCGTRDGRATRHRGARGALERPRRGWVGPWLRAASARGLSHAQWLWGCIAAAVCFTACVSSESRKNISRRRVPPCSIEEYCLAHMWPQAVLDKFPASKSVFTYCFGMIGQSELCTVKPHLSARGIDDDLS